MYVTWKQYAYALSVVEKIENKETEKRDMETKSAT